MLKRKLQSQRRKLAAALCGSFAPDQDKNWFCVEVHRGKEELAGIHLEYQKFEWFGLDYLRSRASARNGQMQEWRNLFPGYIFITFDAFDPRWHRVLSTVGVKRMFRDGQGYPLAIPHDALLAAHISAQNETQRILNSIAPLARRQATSQWQANPLRAGEEVRIKDGPFADLLGVVQYSDQVRVHLLISIFGRDSPAHIPLDYIERV